MTHGVLVVDDEREVARIHRAYVERLPGFAVLGVAHTAADAVESARRLRPDLVLLDVFLPDGSGLDVLRTLRQDPELAPDVVLLTAARDLETVRAALHGGAATYLVKPFTAATLADRLRHWAAARAELLRPDELAQDDVDRVFAVARRPGAVVLPKGLAADTAALVVRVLQAEPGDLSASETGERAGLSRVAARRYLEHLHASGQVQRRSAYGGTGGRPEHRYSWGGVTPAP